jgi:hypothetical protein
MFFFNSLSQEKTKTTTDIICHANQYFAEITKNAKYKDTINKSYLSKINVKNVKNTDRYIKFIIYFVTKNPIYLTSLFCFGFFFLLTLN